MIDKQFTYFTLAEFIKASSDPAIPPCYIENAQEILGVLDVIREEYGSPLIILQGGAYRNQAYNKSLGGAPNSRHLIGQACDIRPLNNHSWEEILKIREIAERLLSEKKLPTVSLLGIGVYKKEKCFIHIDVRKSPFKARWEEK
jgi:uncharacterized protein YcbK (DUF882 family)